VKCDRFQSHKLKTRDLTYALHLVLNSETSKRESDIELHCPLDTDCRSRCHHHRQAQLWRIEVALFCVACGVFSSQFLTSVCRSVLRSRSRPLHSGFARPRAEISPLSVPATGRPSDPFRRKSQNAGLGGCPGNSTRRPGAAAPNHEHFGWTRRAWFESESDGLVGASRQSTRSLGPAGTLDSTMSLACQGWEASVVRCTSCDQDNH
jgi:hypothetical protein